MSGPIVRCSEPKRRQRHHAADIVAHVKAAEIRRIRARILLGLYGHPKRAAEQVEVVDIERAEENLQRAENVGQIEPEQFGFGPVEVVFELRCRRAVGRKHFVRIDLRLLFRLRDQRLRRLLERESAVVGQILELELETTGLTDAGDRRRVERDDDPGVDVGQLFRANPPLLRRRSGRDRAPPTASGWRMPQRYSSRWSR